MKPPDWESLLRRLTAVALGWFGQRNCRGEGSVLPGTGKSPPDLAYDALVAFLKNQQAYRVKSDDDLFRLIVTIMKRDFFDLVKPRREYDRIVILDAGHDDGLSERLANEEDTSDVSAAADAASAAKRFYHLAEGEQPLIDFIDAAAEFGHLPRNEIAELVRVTESELTNMKKKLRYRQSRPHGHDRAKGKGRN
jgi:hypothetical protein